jgi:hypothetical protein
LPQEGHLTEGTEASDLKDLLRDIFADPFTVTQRSAGRWQYNITEGEHAGYVVVIEGNEFSGDGDAPAHGHIQAIVVRRGDTVKAQADGLNLSYEDFAHVFEDHTDEPGDDEPGDDEPDDHGPEVPPLNLDRLRELLKDNFEVSERAGGEWRYDIVDGEFKGYSIVVEGEGFTGDGYVPNAGRIHSVTVLHGDEVVGAKTDIDLPIEALRNKFKHDDGEDLHGGSGDDEIHGGKGDDHFEGGHGHDVLDGGRGDDDLSGGDGDDNLNGGKGDDDLDGEGGDDTMAGGRGSDDLHGKQGDDDLDGGGDRDKLAGGGGDDDLCGNGGSDALKGGGGDDTLTGGAGKDKMIGGGGADHFVFLLATDSPGGDARDVIVDFTPGLDVIDLSAIDADGDATEGDGAFSFIGDAAFGGVAGELRVARTQGERTVTLIAGDTDGDGVADFSIALLGNKVVSGADFVL